ncbi:BgTH12-03814 [Blumeria graminis f. sp. triticale]|uniref:BgTH12-03814 n=1 Tax=Blumeria graminis f. sp. triticale TaxID=1689686 RepID=A0A9W4DHK1_BLUGR|nr:BgTH12-03814 [Blumeria graminis f. sp. triticale]
MFLDKTNKSMYLTFVHFVLH